MLPPVLEIYVVWHPDDPAGEAAAEQFVQHFHGSLFSGLVGGAIEVYVRSQGWRAIDDAPRPIPLPEEPPPNGLAQAQITAIVPVLANELAAAAERQDGPWYNHILRLVAAQNRAPDRVGIFPLLVDPGAVDGTVLGRIFSPFQRIAAPSPGAPPEPQSELRCRDLAQGIAQLVVGPDEERLT